MLGEVNVRDTTSRKGFGPTPKRRYEGPSRIVTWTIDELFLFSGRHFGEGQRSLFGSDANGGETVYLAGSLELLRKPSVSVIGARAVSEAGKIRAAKISKQLAHHGFVVTSGLAKGVDTAAHIGAIDAGGETIGVIGTPLQKAYPIENAWLQEEIFANHLLISQFRDGQRTYQSDFPKRNRLMAAISDGSVIVEASDTSGTLHQAAECLRLGRWLFIMQSVVDDPKLTWPGRFLSNPRTVVLNSVTDIISRVGI